MTQKKSSQNFILTKKAIHLASENFKLQENTPAQYATMKYPKFFPIMNFTVHRYHADGFGTIMTMDTNAMFGMMKLSTLVFTPSDGANVPFLLIDTMQMSKKSLAYVEYYDCTAHSAPMADSQNQTNEFAHIPDYAETPAWYVKRRTPYSLIKQMGDGGQEELDNMVLTCLSRYLTVAVQEEKNLENTVGLKTFQQEMVKNGNPSSATLEKVLGATEAQHFFEDVIMPV